MSKLMKAIYDWSYRGVAAYYSGSGEVAFNCDDTSDAFDIAFKRAKRKVCESGVFHPDLVTISNLSLHEVWQ
jgi:hypothetical protein